MFDPNTKILIVDDMMTMRKLVTKMCKELGFRDFTEASDGAIAWSTLSNARSKFELVISDWNMPHCTGLEFLKQVRADGRFAALPFVLVTAEAEQQQVIEALKAGVSDYVIKPFTVDSLKEKLETVHKGLISLQAA